MSEAEFAISCGGDITATAVASEIVIDAAFVQVPLRIENGYLEETEEPGVWMIRQGERGDAGAR